MFTAITPPDIQDIELLLRQEGRILEACINTSRNSAIHEMQDFLLAVAEEWNAAHPFLILINLSSGNFSPQMRQVSNTISQTLRGREATGKRAIILPSGPIGLVVKSWGNMIGRRNGVLETRLFTQRDPALSWLEEAAS